MLADKTTAIKRAVKQTDSIVTITIDGMATVPYASFNYARISQEAVYYSGDLYGFIVGVASQNDGSKASCTLTIKLDAWANNLSKAEFATTTAVCRRSHFSPLQNGRYDNVLPADTKINLLKDQVCIRPFGTEDGDDIPTDPFLPNRFEVLWLRLTLDDFDAVSFSDGGKSTPLYADQEWYPIIMQPIAVYDKTLNTFSVKTFRISFSESDTACIIAGSSGLSNVNKLIDSNSHIIKAELTYCAPFAINFSYNSSASRYEAAVGWYKYKPITVDGSSFGLGISWMAAANLTHAYDYYPRSQDLIDVWQPEPLAIPGNTINLATLSIYEEYCNKYPFSFYELKYGGYTIPIINPDGCYHTRVEFFRYRLHPFLRFAHESEMGTTYSEQKPVTNFGELLISSSAYDTYMRNNGNQLNTKAINSIVTGVGGSAIALMAGNPSGAAASLLGVSQSIDSTTARIADLKSMQDHITTPSYNAMDNVEQDMVSVYQVYAIGNDVNRFALDFHYYGCNTPRYAPIFKRNREYFDFVQTASCELPYITNIRERSELETAFNRGVTIWWWDSPVYPYTEHIARGNRLIPNNRKDD